jgi:hypothetical protein
LFDLPMQGAFLTGRSQPLYNYIFKASSVDR